MTSYSPGSIIMRTLLSAISIVALATPALGQDYHFTKDVGPGGRV